MKTLTGMSAGIHCHILPKHRGDRQLPGSPDRVFWGLSRRTSYTSQLYLGSSSLLLDTWVVLKIMGPY